MAESAAYEDTYRRYLARLEDIDFTCLQERLGCEATGRSARVPLFGETFQVGSDGVVGPDGRRPHLSVCVILCTYLLRCPTAPPASRGWASFKDFRDAAPLTASFTNTVEGAIARAFARRLDGLRRAADTLGGRLPAEVYPHDFAAVIPALPRVPMLLLFNGADDEFPAACSVLFETCADAYLDMECLAMLGMQLARRLESGCPP
jgi:hypothetical protein